MRKKRKVAFLLLLMSVGFLMAQESIITGRVISKNDGTPLPDVNVVVLGLKIGVVTDFDGYYKIKVENSKGKSLVFSYVGFKEQVVIINNQKIINISLEEATLKLDEVVVTALGIKRESKALGYSITEVKGSEVSQIKTTSAVNSLQGKIAGVNISTNSSGASGSSRVIIRGASSLTGNNQPLYVVDGIPIINNTNGSVVGPFGGEHGDGGDDISSLNPDDIESVSVLKGSSAAALYGSLASNGVIMIVTKSGKNKQNFGIEFSSSYTFEQINTNLQNFQTKYGQGNNRLKPGYEYDAANNPVEIVDMQSAIDDSFTSSLQSWGAPYDGSLVYNWDGVKRPYSYTGNNLDKFYQTGSTAVNSIALTKGGEQYHYRFSFSNLENADIFPKTTLNRKSISLSVSAKVNNKLTSSTNVKYIIENVNNRITIGDTPGNANTVAYVLPGSLNIYDLKPGVNEQGTELVFQPSMFISNPYWAVNKFNNNDKKNRIILSTNLRYDINDWLFTTARVGLDSYELSRKRVTPYGTAYRFNGELYQGKSTYSLVDADVMLGTKNEILKNLTLNSIIGVNTRTSIFEGLNATGRGFIVTDLEDLNNTTLPEPNYSYYKTKTNSIYGSLEVGYNDYLYLTFTGRNDWFSTLSFPGKKTPNNDFYWSASGSFLLNKAIELPSQINFAKFRANYAQVAGGARNAYALNLDYAVTGTFQGQSYGELNGNIIPNPNLVPFQKNEFEVGMDGRFFNSRLTIDMAYYVNNTTKDIVRASASQSSGFTSSILNIGELQNKGIEFLIGIKPIKNKDFVWESSFNFTHNKSKILHTDDEDTPINVDGSQTRSKNAIISHIVGEPFGVIFGSSYKRDENGNILYDISGSIPKAIQGENKILGQGVAPLTLGFFNSFNYNNFTLSFLVDAKFGGSVHSGTNRELTLRGLHKQTLEGREGGLEVKGIDDATGQPFTKVVAPENLRTYYGLLAEENAGIAEAFIYSTDFVKFREFSLSYDFPKSLIKKLYMNDLKLSFIGRNLFYIHKKIENVDPEASLNNLNSQGIERFGVPATRSYGLSLNVKF